MRIDHTHKSWLAASLGIFAVAALLYLLSRSPAAGPSMGGTAAGLVFGITGFAFMIFAALLGARKKAPAMRVGRAQSWMRGHLWLGLLSLPLILFHAGFRSGHGLTAVLTALLIVVVVSGVFGAAMQHLMPRVITREVPMETIYEEIEHVREQLLEEATELVAGAAPPPAAAEPAASDSVAETPVAGGAAAPVAAKTAAKAAAPAATAGIVTEQEAAPLREFFRREMEPFFAAPRATRHVLADPGRARGAFEQLRKLVPPALHTMVEDLENICDEQRQLTRQATLHRWLHGWLLLHVPVSLALILLGAIHAVMALRY